MRKNFIYKIVGLALLIVSILSCDTADQDVSPIVSPDDSYPAVTFTSDFTGSTVAEGDTIVYFVSINKPIDKALTFTASVIGGDADDSDIEVISGTINPYTTETKVSVIFTKDWPAEDDETVEVEIGIFSLANKYLVQTSTVNPVLSLTISNYVSDDLTMVFEWDKDIFVNAGYEDFPDYGWEISTCSEVDFDIFIADAEGFDINDPWATFNPVIYAATGDCPEEMTFSGLPDGSYIIFCELWYNGFVDSLEFPDPQVVTHELMPITSTFKKQGVFEVTYVQDASQVINSATPGCDNDSYAGEIVDTFVAKVTIAGNKYTIIDFDDAELGGGKGTNSKNRTPRPANIIKK